MSPRLFDTRVPFQKMSLATCFPLLSTIAQCGGRESLNLGREGSEVRNATTRQDSPHISILTPTVMV